MFIISFIMHWWIQWLSLLRQVLLRQKFTKPILFSGEGQGSPVCLEAYTKRKTQIHSEFWAFRLWHWFCFWNGWKKLVWELIYDQMKVVWRNLSLAWFKVKKPYNENFFRILQKPHNFFEQISWWILNKFLNRFLNNFQADY